MSGSGNCHVCGSICFKFHYARPRLNDHDTHEGFWHCEEHGPIAPTATQLSCGTKPPATADAVKFPPHMNRAARRKLMRARINKLEKEARNRRRA